ncbi:hypothetical protein ZWY2020_059949 [Hordeum vulgare]|nr:hypothetical protein ZWY2020_059949 [Hordeum vulgare]
MSYPCLRRAAVPVKRVWLGLRGRLGLRRSTGLGELRREVRTCEYDDVHVMWSCSAAWTAARRGSTYTLPPPPPWLRPLPGRS